MNILKERARAGDRLFGVWLAMASPSVAEILAYAGFDFLVIDNEHGQGSLKDAVDIMRAAEAGGTSCIVRIPINDPVYLKRILDAGAQSLMIPMVNSAKEAADAVAACRYPPDGYRGFAATAQRCSRFGVNKDYVAKAKDDLFLLAQIESAEAAGRSFEIASVNGIDMILIGVNDLSGSVGHLGDFAHPDVVPLISAAEDGTRRAGKLLATVPTPNRSTNQLFADGYDLVAGPVDSLLLREAAENAIREVIKKPA